MLDSLVFKTGADVLFVMNYPAYVGEDCPDDSYAAFHPGLGYKYSSDQVSIHFDLFSSHEPSAPIHHSPSTPTPSVIKPVDDPKVSLAAAPAFVFSPLSLL